MKLLLLFLVGFNSAPLFAQNHAATPAEQARAMRHNFQYQQLSQPRAVEDILRPVEEYGHFRYVLMSAYTGGDPEVEYLRKTIAKNLPADMVLVILAERNNVANQRRKYEQWVPGERLIIAAGDSVAGGFWARDSFPIPVLTKAGSKGALVSQEYFRHFPSHPQIAASVNAGIVADHNFVFVGGNLLADEDGNCFAVDSTRMFGLSANTLKTSYGCKQMHMLPHVAGIGDVDEVIKPLPGKKMLTNIPSYVNTLRGWGYTVIMLPEIPNSFRTYANTLIVNGTAFMPTYNSARDDAAAQVYRELGFKVVKIPSSNLSDYQNGSIHCQTMAYPDMDLSALLGQMNYKIVESSSGH